MANNQACSCGPPKDARQSRWDQHPRRDSVGRQDSGFYEGERSQPAPRNTRDDFSASPNHRRASDHSTGSLPPKRTLTGNGAAGTARSANPPTALSSNAPSLPPSDFSQDIQKIVNLFSDRSFYFTQRDAAEKKYKERHHEWERCQTSNFSSAIDILEYQLKAADTERTKAAQCMSAVDEKLLDVSMACVHKWSATLDSKILAATKGVQGHLTPPPSETSDHPMFDVEEKLAWLKDTVESTLAKRVSEEAKTFQSMIIAGYESRIEDLNLRLDKEKAARSAAEQKLENFATRLESMEVAMGKLTQTNTSEETEAMKKHMARLEAKMAQTDEAGSSFSAELGLQKGKITQLFKKASATDAELKAAAAKQAKQGKYTLRTNPQTCQTTSCQVNYESLANTVEELSTLRGKIDAILSKAGPASQTEERVVEIVNREVAVVEGRLQGKLKAIADAFGPMIDTERLERDKMAATLEQMATDVAEGAVSISDSIVAIQDLQAHFKDLQVKVFQQNGGTSDKLIQHANRINEAGTELMELKADTQRGLEDLSMQLQGVTSWQNHFTSETLYDSIVAHINEALVQKYAGELRMLASRLDVVERNTDDSLKRRKVPMGHVGAMSSHAPPS